MSGVLKLIPRWTQRVTFEAGGRDPLGLDKWSDLLKGQLLSGIVTNNHRARYYSFFCWAIWHIDVEEPAKRYRDFIEKWRRREAALALATLAHNARTSPIGIEMTAPALAKGRVKGEVDTDFLVLKSNILGVFGQHYRGSLYELGLIHRTEDGLYHVTPAGESLARTLHTTLEKTPYVKQRLYEAPTLALKDLEKSQSALTLDAVREKSAPREREELVEAFFKLRGKKVTERDTWRRHTLALILHVASEYERYGAPAELGQVDNHIVYPVYYYDVLWLRERKVVPYKCPELLRPALWLWKQFCLQHYFTQAMENLLHCLLWTVSADTSGLPVDDAIDRLIGEGFHKTLREIAGARYKTPRDLFRSFGIVGVPDERLSARLRKEVGLLAAHSEFNLDRWEQRPTPLALAARAFATLALLYGKWRGAVGGPAFNSVARQAGAGFWLGSIFSHFDRWVSADVEWREVMRSLHVELVLNQHYRVLRERRKPDSVWVRLSEGRIVKEHDYQATYRTTRHPVAVNILLDLLLLRSDAGGSLGITKAGRRVLQEVLG